MPRIPTVDRAEVPSQTQNLLDGVEKKLGMLPNMIAAMAQSPAAVQGYLGLSQALAGGLLPPRLREQIALTVSQYNGCNYCLAAHSAIGGSLGLSSDEVSDSRNGSSPNRKTEAALQFARLLVENRGSISDEQFATARAAGYSGAELTEIIAQVALHTFTNYFNKTAQSVVDFPRVETAVGV